VIGGTGVFTKAIEDALLAGTIDIAIHSLKDLPSEMTPGLILGAVPAREDVRDALVTRNGVSLSDLPAGARIGTGSGRRAVQLRAMRADVRPDEIRGNVDTRIRKVLSGEYDGAVLALAGLLRLGLEEHAAQIFSAEEMLPAVGQAALGVQVRADDAGAIALTSAIEHAPTRRAVEAERAFLRRLGAGCRMPAGACATIDGDSMHISGLIAGDAPGAPVYRASIDGPSADPDALGVRLAEMLFAQGAEAFVAQAGGAP
jgi:hydroxymethylbilane synthase